LLGILPCQDKADVLSVQQHTTEIQYKASDTNHIDEDTCPPFCSCACCSVAQFFPIERTAVLVTSVLQKPFTGFHLLDLKSQPTNIWQPPKLV
jgi:hypothetical protein